MQLVAQYVGGAATLLTIRLFMTLVGAIVARWWGHFAREAAILTRSLAEAYLGRPRLVGDVAALLWEEYDRMKVVLRLLLYPVFWLGRMPQHFVFMRHRLIDLKLWLVYGCIVAYSFSIYHGRNC